MAWYGRNSRPEMFCKPFQNCPKIPMETSTMERNFVKLLRYKICILLWIFSRELSKKNLQCPSYEMG